MFLCSSSPRSFLKVKQGNFSEKYISETGLCLDGESLLMCCVSVCPWFFGSLFIKEVVVFARCVKTTRCI